MTSRICVACGVLQKRSSGGPDHCAICEDDRQFVPAGGQQWTSSEMLRSSYRIVWSNEMEGVWSLRMEPEFAIGQRAFLIQGSDGNILWDCISLIDDETRTRIDALGGLSVIAISHPHFYSSIANWGRAFGAPVFVHDDDARWIQEPDGVVRCWGGETLPLGSGATAIRCGGHFAGASVLHVGHVNDGRGALFSGDTIQVVADRRHVSFMRSYPNLIPLNADAVRGIAGAVEPFEFDAIFGAFAGRTILTGAKQAIRVSAERYTRAIAPTQPDE
jgi:hypothetical protein